METTVVTYVGEKAHERGVRKMAKQGWRVLNATTSVPAMGCISILLCIFTFGIFALLFREDTHFVVTFVRGWPAPQPGWPQFTE